MQFDQSADRSPAKKESFLRPYSIPPHELSGHNFFGFFIQLQKKLFFLSDPAFPPPPFVAGPLKKNPFCDFYLKPIKVPKRLNRATIRIHLPDLGSKHFLYRDANIGSFLFYR